MKKLEWMPFLSGISIIIIFSFLNAIVVFLILKLCLLMKNSVSLIYTKLAVMFYFVLLRVQ